MQLDYPNGAVRRRTGTAVIVVDLIIIIIIIVRFLVVLKYDVRDEVWADLIRFVCICIVHFYRNGRWPITIVSSLATRHENRLVINIIYIS